MHSMNSLEVSSSMNLTGGDHGHGGGSKSYGASDYQPATQGSGPKSPITACYWEREMSSIFGRGGGGEEDIIA